MTQLVSCKEIKKALKWVIDDKQKGEIGFCYVRHLNDYSFYNREQMGEQMKVWRKLVKEGTLVIQEANHRSPTIHGKQFYTFVIQTADLDAHPMEIDRLGLGFDDRCFLVSGHIYVFKTEANRDSTFKYVMTGKSK